ncbi:MAG: radical SAM protein [Coriobacteriales bacterium]|jgi:MoaA/NifB/PqqE/SkfB family radical SAM enzyme|nr:radical SAM protein [Coriobacteriales bacterium]
MKNIFYLPFWFARAKFLGQRRPLQSVVFINDLCNLKCRHCSIYARSEPTVKTYEQIRDELQYCFNRGSRFVDYEGGEPTLWRDGDKDLNSLVLLAKEIGFFSVTVTTNAIRPFAGLLADSIWVSLDGIGDYHDAIRGDGAFQKLSQNIATCEHDHVCVNMVVNPLNYASVPETIEFAKENPYIKQISINFHTPFPGTEDLFLDWEKRAHVIDQIIALKRQGYPIMNSISGLRAMKHNKFPKECWVTNFIMIDGTRLDQCQGYAAGVCDRCGFCMAGEMHSVMHLKPDTLLAGLHLRL